MYANYTVKARGSEDKIVTLLALILYAFLNELLNELEFNEIYHTIFSHSLENPSSGLEVFSWNIVQIEHIVIL